ncbi:MAG TPA: hypothetical protein VNG90_04480, partial [Candidatus Acidoferrum sp.]|nr:hypothetical protein [Candidatus Acidoferrum sp.]
MEAFTLLRYEVLFSGVEKDLIFVEGIVKEPRALPFEASGMGQLCRLVTRQSRSRLKCQRAGMARFIAPGGFVTLQFLVETREDCPRVIELIAKGIASRRPER